MGFLSSEIIYFGYGYVSYDSRAGLLIAFDFLNHENLNQRNENHCRCQIFSARGGQNCLHELLVSKLNAES